MSSEPGLVVYRFGAGIFYANAQHLTDELMGLASGDNPPRWIIIDAAAIDDVDFTGGRRRPSSRRSYGDRERRSPLPIRAGGSVVRSSATA